MVAKALKSRITPIGIDIGSSAIRGAQLRRIHDAFSVAFVGQLDRGITTQLPSEPLDVSLRRLCAQGAFQGRSIIMAMNPPELEFHVIDVPQAALRGDGADQIIHFEIGRLSSLSADAIETRHWVLPAHPGNSANAIGISVKREAVSELLEVCKRGKLRCRCIEAGATALHRFARLLRPWAGEEIWGVLDLGSRHSRLILCNRDAPLLIRHTGDGGTIWTERVAEGLELSVAAAEIQKKNHGVAVLGRKDDRSDAAAGRVHDEVAVMVLSALRSELNEMAAEIKRSYEYVLNCYPGRRAADLVLVGGGALMPNLPEFLSGMLGIPVRRCGSYLGGSDCRLQFRARGRQQVEESATAIGLSLAEAMP